MWPMSWSELPNLEEVTSADRFWRYSRRRAKPKMGILTGKASLQLLLLAFKLFLQFTTYFYTLLCCFLPYYFTVLPCTSSFGLLFCIVLPVILTFFRSEKDFFIFPLAFLLYSISPFIFIFSYPLILNVFQIPVYLHSYIQHQISTKITVGTNYNLA